MKKFFVLIILFFFLNFSCQRKQKEEVEGKHLKGKEKVKASQNLKKDEREKEKLKAKLLPSDLTEEEQKFSEQFSVAYTTPSIFRSFDEAKRFLEILIKVKDPFELKWFVLEHGDEDIEIAHSIFDGDMACAVWYTTTGALCEHVNLIGCFEGLPEDVKECLSSKECFELIMATYEKAKERYPKTLEKIAKAMRYFKIERKRRIEVLKDLIKSKNPMVRLEASASLLDMGEGTIALPVLAELAKEGETLPLPYLFKNGWDDGPWEFWDERGLKILKEAIDYPTDEIRAEACIFLGRLGIEKEKASKLALEILNKYKDMTIEDFGISNKIHIDEIPKELKENFEKCLSSSRACDYAMAAIEAMKILEAIPILKHISNHNIDWFYICKDYSAASSLEVLEKEVKK